MMNSDTASHAPRHIYVIDDEPVMLDLYRVMLGDEGYRITLESFRDRDLVRQHRRICAAQPDLLVLDLMLWGVLAGWTLLTMLKMTPATARLPIILCTAAMGPLDGLETHLASIGIEVVRKPFNIDDFLEAIQRALQPRGGRQWPAAAPDASNASISSSA